MYYREKIRFRVIGIIAVIIVLWCVIFITDYIRVENNNTPIFCLPLGESYDDGGSNEYYGLFYKVNKYVYLNDDTVKFEIGGWGLEFDKPKYNVNIYYELDI